MNFNGSLGMQPLILVGGLLLGGLAVVLSDRVASWPGLWKFVGTGLFATAAYLIVDGQPVRAGSLLVGVAVGVAVGATAVKFFQRVSA